MFAKYIISAALAACISSIASATDYVVMLQQTPVQGGIVTPGSGVHNVPANSSMSITATPKPGYQFVYWLGDVVDSSSQTTTVAANAPKLVIAVFQRDQYELPFQEPQAPDSAGSDEGGLTHNYVSINGGGDISPATGYPTYNLPTQKPPENKEPPVPTPEPATMILFALGAALAVKTRIKGV
jgi:hypothetical protein